MSSSKIIAHFFIPKSSVNFPHKFNELVLNVIKPRKEHDKRKRFYINNTNLSKMPRGHGCLVAYSMPHAIKDRHRN